MRAGNRPQTGYKGKWCQLMTDSFGVMLLRRPTPLLSTTSAVKRLPFHLPSQETYTTGSLFPWYSSLLRSFLWASKNALVFVIFKKKILPQYPLSITIFFYFSEELSMLFPFSGQSGFHSLSFQVISDLLSHWIPWPFFRHHTDLPAASNPDGHSPFLLHSFLLG